MFHENPGFQSACESQALETFSDLTAAGSPFSGARFAPPIFNDAANRTSEENSAL
jgi:hypothetical protein